MVKGWGLLFVKLTQEQTVKAVLFLEKPPATSGFANWYLREIVGLPFLLINLLNLQKGGISHVGIFSRDWSTTDIENLNIVSKDNRLNLKITWLSDTEEQKEFLLNEDCQLIASGMALHQHQHIENALKGKLSDRGMDLSGYWEIPNSLKENIFQENGEVDIQSIPNLVGTKITESSPPRWKLLLGSLGNQIKDRIDFSRQKERLLKQAGMENDSLMDRWVTRHASQEFTRFFVQTSVTPNQITWMHLIVGIVSAGFFYQGDYALNVMGSFLLMISLWLDSSDGEVARLTFRQSKEGAQFDIIADNIVHFAVFWAIGIGLFLSTGEAVYKWLGGLAVLGSFLCYTLMQSEIQFKRSDGKAETRAVEVAHADEFINRDFIYLLFFLALVDQLPIFLGLTAIGSLVFAGIVAYGKFKSAKFEN